MSNQRLTLFIITISYLSIFLPIFNLSSNLHSTSVKGAEKLSNIDYNIEETAYTSLRLPTCPEVVSNKEFDNGNTGWNFYVNTGNSASMSIDNSNKLSGINSATVNISTASGTAWHISMFQDGKTLDASKTYILSFDASAVANRTIDISLQERGPTDWSFYWYQTVSLTTSKQSFSYEFTPTGNSAANAGIMFLLGGSNENVFIDNVSFKEKCSSAPASVDCPVTNIHPGFALDLSNTDTWKDYDLGSNLQIVDNQNGTISIFGDINNAIDADWDGGTATPCGSDDEWYLTLNLSDRKSWAEWQAMGGTSNLHSNCSADGLDYWAVSGTLAGKGCNAGKTLTINAASDNYRLQIGYGGNSQDANCDLGLSTWFDIIDENGQVIQADIYAFLQESCYSSGATPPPTAISDQPLNPIAQAGEFNFFIEEDMESRNGDIEGTGAVGGDLTLRGSNTVASNRSGNFQVSGDSRPTGLVIGGRIIYTSGSGINVNQSTYVKLGDATGTNVHDTQNGNNVVTRLTSGGYNSNPALALQTHQPGNTVVQSNLIDFTSIFDDFRCLSSGMAKMNETTTIQVSGGQAAIQLNSNTVNVVNTTGNVLNSMQGLTFQGTQPSSSSPLIINVDAAGTFNWNVPSFNSIGDNHGNFIIINFYNSTTINLNNGNTITANFFAPRAHVNKNGSGNVNGQMIAKSYMHGAGELHHHPFNPIFEIPDCSEICDNGKDDDGDGQIDCDDNECGKPSIISVNSNPISNCGNLSSGSIVITASGSNLRYSINNGNTYQSNPNFDNLFIGTYQIRVKNDLTGCVSDYTSDITLVGPSCPEVCNNGVDDDKDGQIDCDDGDCARPSIISVNSTPPSNCAQLNNGSIVITATGNNLLYSITNGTNYQSSNSFGNLSNGTYQIRVKNNSTGCYQTYSTDINFNTTCYEICNNGIDDDGDGDIDENDSECFLGCISSFPYTEGFETDLGAWEQSTADDMDWTRRTGSTTSGSTGPPSAVEGAYYIYTEASSNFNKTTYITGPCFDLTGVCEADFSFQYHMYGTATGTLEVELSADNANTWSSIWNLSGDQGENWLSATIPLDSYAERRVQLRFKGVTGTAFTSDISVDDIALTTLTCSTVEICDNGIDDDGDGQVDCNDGDCGKPSNVNVNSNPTSCPQLNNGSIVISASGSDLRYSINNGNDYQSNPNFDNLSNGTYQIRVKNNTTGCYQSYSTNINFNTTCSEICDNGIDDDGDGQVDCNDGDCGKPTITTVQDQNPTNCPNLNNGTITITATGANLEYSINNGSTYQASNVFNNLTAGTYRIMVSNTSTGCTESHGSNVILTDPSCSEICDNGIDDDGDGQIDSNDSDCNCPQGIENMALGKTASQSSNAGGGASRAIDGNTNGVYGGGSVTHTATSGTNWWQVDLGDIRDIKNITLWNRTDCCGGRLSDFYVFVSDTPFTSDNPTTTAGQAAVWNTSITSLSAPSITVSPLRTGRYVRVQLQNAGVLSLAEVQVLGCVLPENCSDGIDNDKDGFVDCADSECGKPTITSTNSTDPSNCPALNNGSITINATGSNLEYSINGGSTYQSSNVFSNLSAGTFNIQVRNSATACTVDHTSTITLVDPSCSEICDNGIDDDGDGQIDSNDSDCNCPLGLENMALGKTASQSSNGGGAASRAIDGNTNGVYGGGSVTHTATSGTNWWQVDLGDIRDIKNITLWNRTDCCGGRLSDFYVFVSDTPFTSDNPTTTAGQAAVWNTSITSLSAPSITVSPLRTGRYVRVQLQNAGVLSLAEVQVLGCVLPENCSDGIDNDKDGFVDCADSECGKPTITSANSTDPSNCPALNNGSITINAIGPNLEYSINGGGTYQSSNIFSNLSAGDFNIQVRNSATACTVDHTSTITLVDPSCSEICDNGIDDDGDGQIDSNDSDCNCPQGIENMALGKTASQSSTGAGGGASRAIDGNTNGVWSGGSITHTATSGTNWWQVDLGDIRDIKNITLWNRTDCCADRLSDFYVFVSDTPFTSDNPTTTAGQAAVWNTSITSLSAPSITVSPLRTGRYVRVQLQNAGVLSLAEVQVLGCVLPENCSDGIDNDKDGFVDCADSECGKPTITSANDTSPNNCPALDNGSITITATGSNLEYSINGGGAYQSSNVFSNLSAGDFNIRVRNTTTGCTADYTSTISLVDSSCSEICNNGIDDDGDGEIDCNDGDCTINNINIQPSVTEDCTQDGSGAIDLSVSGGNSPYTYQWSDMPTPTAYWGFDNTTNDISGNGHHENTANSLGTSSYSNDAKEGTTSLSLNGNTYLRYSQDNAFMETSLSSFAVSFWMKPSNLSGTKVIFDEGGVTNGVAVYLVDNQLRFATRNGGIQKNAGDLTVPNDNNWHYVVAVFQNNELALYLDGNKGTTVNAGYTNGLINSHTGNGGIGYLDTGSGNGAGDGSYYSGLLDGFKYYHNQPFTASQLVDLARNDGNRTLLSGNQNYTVTVSQADGKCQTSTGIFISDTCQEICDNGIDDDGDGQIDCNDGDCSTPIISSNSFTSTSANLSDQLSPNNSELVYSLISPPTYGSLVLQPDGSFTYIPPSNFCETVTFDYKVCNKISNCCAQGTATIDLTLTCPEICGNGIDDDGDGDIDCNDGDCGKPVITSVTPTNPNNCPDLNNGTITIVATGGDLEYSIDNGNTFQSNNQFSNLVKGTYNIRVRNAVSGCLATSTTALSDSSCDENCTDGIDNNGDGQIDCEDDACGKPSIIEIVPANPDNCPVLDNGSITIIAAGSNLQYSLDGETFQNARIFSNLSAALYIVTVKNSVTGCEMVANSPIDLSDPICIEICDNGHDDDGDGLIDCADGDCGQAVINDVNFTDPDNCPDADNGTITITATGTNLEYSIDNGSTYQSNNTFNGLFAGSYVIIVRNSISGCEETYIQNPVVLVEPACEEECGNGIDDDGDGLIDYQDDACENSWPQVFAPNATWLCGGNDYTFEVPVALPGFTYEWNFGPYASLVTATGIGPHTIQFEPPTGTEAIFPAVSFRAITSTYEVRDTFNFQVRPEIVITNIETIDPSDCGVSDGGINLNIQKQSNACVEISFDGGNAWVQQNRIRFDQLESGDYTIVARYCGEDCGTNSNIVTLTNPNTSTILGNDDFTDICPGQIYSNTVISNDIVRNRTAKYSLDAPTSQGEVTMQADGSFEYIVADSTFCGIDQFSYNVCNQDSTCCATAFVTLFLTDTTDPILENVPDDITISCDEEVPLPPFITAFDNCPAISISTQEVSTQGLDGCALHSYTITRSWTATDVCGNSTTDEQVISIEDAIAPDIFRIYTLPNGKKLVAGVMENVSEDWKTVSFPIQFANTPLVFSQVVSNKDESAVITRIRNISANQFELKIQKEEAATDPHFRETVSWIAMEAGDQTDAYLLNAKTIDVTFDLATINFTNAFNNTPACFMSMQTINEEDPGAPRISTLANNFTRVHIQEEKSADTEVVHATETMAYLAVEQVGNITNSVGDIIGEVGTIDINQDWTRIITKNTYYNPIIITQVATNNSTDPVLSRVNMENSGSFDLRLQEWAYQDGAHATETVHFIIIEGSLPLNVNKYCQYGTDSLELGVDMVAVDNCDPSVNIQYAESQSVAGANNHTIRTWFAEDACGNNTVYSQVINCQGIALRMKAYLQGALVDNGTTGLMRDGLREKGLIPTTEPYSDMEGFTHVGSGGGETVSEAMLAQTGNDAIVDWVFIEVKEGDNFENVVVTSSALLQRDGDVVTTEGEPIISFYNLTHGDYYIKLRHRNHLGMETAYPYTFTANNVPFIDFNDGFTPVRGNTPRVEVDDKLASWSGDLNGDDLTIFQGPNNDIFYMFLQILLDAQNEDKLTNFISAGYTTRDFNMDGTVIFQGPNNDRSILLWNTVYNHPDNEQFQSNFVVTTAETVTQANYDDCVIDNTQSFCDFDNDGTLNSSDPDDDNDGVADGNDINPYDKNSDSDGDGISDDMETGQDGIYQSGTDTDPLSPCDPHQDNGVCVGIDIDGDSLFFNYPVNHAKYDPNDQNACEPNGEAAACSCPDEDGDGFIFACLQNANEGSSTIRIPVEDWLAQQASGAVCGPCQNAFTATGCEQGVNLLASAHAEVKGVDTELRLLNFEIPRGDNRTLVIIADFERVHCADPSICDPNQNPNGNSLGDNFAFKNTSSGIPFISTKLTGSAGSIFLHSSVESSIKRNILLLNSMDGTREKTYHSRELYMLTLEEASIKALLGNVNAGTININLPSLGLSSNEADEGILFAYVFENVAQEINAINLFKGNLGSNDVTGDFTLPLNDFGGGMPTNQEEDGLLVIGLNAMEDASFNTLDGFTELNNVSIQNQGGNFTTRNEGDGMSTSIQFKNGIILSPLQLQSTGTATSPSIGGAGLAFAIQSCYDGALATPPPLLDQDNDGYYVNVDPTGSNFDPDDTNSCIPNVCDDPAPCEDFDGDGFIIMCKLVPGSTDQRSTQKIAVSSWATNQHPEDYCGPCVEFKTIAEGYWDDPNVWEGGQIPPYILNDQDVIINHPVVTGQNVSLNNDSYLWIQNGTLTLPDNDLEIFDANLYAIDAVTTVNGNINLHTANSKMVAKRGILNITRSFNVHKGIVELHNIDAVNGEWLDYTMSDPAVYIHPTAEFNTSYFQMICHNDFIIEGGQLNTYQSCFNVKRDWRNKGTATLDLTCLEVGKDIVTTANSQTVADSLNIYISGFYPAPSGKLTSDGEVQGHIGAFYLADGNANVSNWSATIDNHVVNGTSNIPSNYIIEEDTDNIVYDFSECTCLDYIVPFSTQGEEEICDNGIDDDGDGLIDCADGDCDTACSSLPCEDFDGDGFIIMCKLIPGSTDQRSTQKVAISDWANKHPEDYCGPCVGFKTIAEGYWDDPNVWEGGQIPPYILDDQDVIINHPVVSSQNVSLNNDSYLWVQNSTLTLPDNDLEINDANFYSIDATTTINGNVDLYTANSKMVVKRGILNITRSFNVHKGIVELHNIEAVNGEWLDYTISDPAVYIHPTAEFNTSYFQMTCHNDFIIEGGQLNTYESCFNVKRDWRNNGTATLDLTCLEVGKDIVTTANSQTVADSLNIYISGFYPAPSGKLTSDGDVQGHIGALYVADGNAEVSNWTAIIDNHVVSGTSNIPNNYIIEEDTDNIVYDFSECTCLDYIVPFSSE